MRVCRVYKEQDQVVARIEKMAKPDLVEGEVLIESEYSGINYKDALAVTGRAPILRKYPLIAGIDVAGRIYESKDPRFKKGEAVLVTGCGFGENHDGGYAEYAKAQADWVVPLPQGLSSQEAMILGTAGFTAALSLHRMEQNGQSPEKGPIVVTGASGGVGMLATHLLSQQGYEVIAVSSKAFLEDELKALGAKQVVAPQDLALGSRPLEQARFAGAIDNVGGELLAGLCRHIDLWGNVACVGLAASAQLHTTVMPLILRGVSLLGISSNNCPLKLRHDLWQRLATDWKLPMLPELVKQRVDLDSILRVSQDMLDRKTCGRTLVQFLA